jgi:hypothetical protein
MANYKNAQSKAATEYNKRSTVCFTVRLNVNTDADIITALESVGNKNALIKKLIRDAIAGDNSEV